MVFERLTEEKIMEMCIWLEFYDSHGYFPFQKKRIDITLSVDLIEKLKTLPNKSRFIEEVIRPPLMKN